MINEEAKALAEATFMKKRMYYNMRIKTIQRNASNVIRVMKKAEQMKLSIINTNINAMIRLIKDVEKEMGELTNLPPGKGFGSAILFGSDAELD